MIKVQNYDKYYGDLHAVKNISFEVQEGSFFALLGPNGAGKSTTIETIATLLKPTSGEVFVNGYQLGKDDRHIRTHLGVVFQYSVLDRDLTVYENLKIRSTFYDMDHHAFKKRLDHLNQVMELDGILDQKIKTLSGGQKRKADIARALLHDPKLLMLDEPTTGLDPKSRKAIWALILKLKQRSDMTILLTTHYMEEVIDADHVIILHEGKIVAEDTAEQLRINHAHDTLKIYPKTGCLKKLKDLNIPFTQSNTSIKIELSNAFEGLDIINQMKPYIESFEIIKASMDDVFLNITGEVLEEAGE